MAEARPKDKSWEAQRAAILEHVPNIPIPLQMGPGVSSTVGTRELLDQLIPRTNTEMLISSLPLGALFAAAPDPLKRQMISLLRKGENKARIAKKMLEGNPALGKAAEALMLFTGKKGGLPYRPREGATNIEELSRTLDDLYRGEAKIPAGELPVVDVEDVYPQPRAAARSIRTAQEAGLPVQGAGRLTTPSQPLSGVDLLTYRERGVMPRARGPMTPEGGPRDVNVSNLDELLRLLSQPETAMQSREAGEALTRETTEVLPPEASGELARILRGVRIQMTPREALEISPAMAEQVAGALRTGNRSNLPHQIEDYLNTLTDEEESDFIVQLHDLVQRRRRGTE